MIVESTTGMPSEDSTQAALPIPGVLTHYQDSADGNLDIINKGTKGGT